MSDKWTYINMQDKTGTGILPLRCNPSKPNSVLCAAAVGATEDQKGCGWGQYSVLNPPTTNYTYETGCPGWNDANGNDVCETLNCNTTPSPPTEHDQCWRKMQTPCERTLSETGSGGTGLVWFVDPYSKTSAACTAREKNYNDYCGTTATAATAGVETVWGQRPPAGSNVVGN